MLNFDGSSSAPNAMIRSSGTPGSSRELAPDGLPTGLPKYRFTISTGNRSMPAGTGVCVVNTVLERTTVSAVSKSSPSVISSRMRSTPRKPAWPSFMWNTSGAGRPSISVNARIARTPPIPARISCLIRCSWSPPYSRSVTPRRSCSFSGMSESNSSNGIRPTCAIQTRARSWLESGIASSTSTGLSASSVSSRSGSPCGSSDG